jgi:hypothetical protein
MRSLSLIVMLALMAALAGGCGGGDDGDPTDEPTAAPATSAATDAGDAGPTATTEPVATDSGQMAAPGPEAEAALAAVEAFDPAELDASIERLNATLFPEGELTTDNVVALLAPLLVDEQPERRWAALYVVALAADSPQEAEALRAMLTDPEPIFRVHAAGSLARLGVVDALPVLIEGLDLEGGMPFSDPPLPVSDHARTTLEYYTGQSFPDAAGWRDWWEQTGEVLTWDGERFVAG